MIIYTCFDYLRKSKITDEQNVSKQSCGLLQNQSLLWLVLAYKHHQFGQDDHNQAYEQQKYLVLRFLFFSLKKQLLLKAIVFFKKKSLKLESKSVIFSTILYEVNISDDWNQQKILIIHFPLILAQQDLLKAISQRVCNIRLLFYGNVNRKKQEVSFSKSNRNLQEAQIDSNFINCQLIIKKSTFGSFSFQAHYQFLQIKVIKHIFQMSKLILFALLVIFINSMTFSQHAARLGPKFRLKFDYAARQGAPLDVSSFSVLWNGNQLNEAFSKNYEVLSATYTVFAIVGENILNFVGTGTSATKGAGITNVELIRRGKCGLDDVLSNGNFKDATNVGTSFKLFKGGIRGWKAEEIEVGYGQYYNSNWDQGTVVLALNTNSKSDIFQSVFLNARWEQVSADQIPA